MTTLSRSIVIQVFGIVVLWCLFIYYILQDPRNNLEPKITIATFIAIPAAVIGVAQLLITAHIQRASYIKDYALRFRTDKELSESFHYLVYRFGNTLYESFIKAETSRTPDESAALKKSQDGIAAELQFFNPKDAVSAPQERRLDNLLGFFDTVGYDHQRGMLHMRDVAGVFGFQLDHLVQRKVIQEYLYFVQQQWPKKESFHESYTSPTPFRYLRALIHSYVQYRKAEDQRVANKENAT